MCSRRGVRRGGPSPLPLSRGGRGVLHCGAAGVPATEVAACRACGRPLACADGGGAGSHADARAGRPAPLDTGGCTPCFSVPRNVGVGTARPCLSRRPWDHRFVGPAPPPEEPDRRASGARPPSCGGKDTPRSPELPRGAALPASSATCQVGGRMLYSARTPPAFANGDGTGPAPPCAAPFGSPKPLAPFPLLRASRPETGRSHCSCPHRWLGRRPATARVGARAIPARSLHRLPEGCSLRVCPRVTVRPWFKVQSRRRWPGLPLGGAPLYFTARPLTRAAEGDTWALRLRERICPATAPAKKNFTYRSKKQRLSRPYLQSRKQGRPVRKSWDAGARPRSVGGP